MSAVKRRAIALTGIVALVFLASAGCTEEGSSRAAQPTAPASRAAPQAVPLTENPADAALWLTFDEVVTSEGGLHKFRDQARGAFIASIQTTEEGAWRLAEGPSERGRALAFPAPCTDSTECPRAAVIVPHAKRFNPGDAAFAYGATVMVAANETTTGSNVVQKGRFATAGGQWKLQIDTVDGKPSCVVRGDLSMVVVRSPVGVADGQWHRVTCVKDASGLVIEVDGEATREMGAAGRVSGKVDVRVGSSGLGQSDDQFHGSLDDVFLVVGEATPR